MVRGPDPEMSLTSGGHIVEVDSGRLVRTNDLVKGDTPPALADLLSLEERAEPADIRDNTVIPRRRLTEKTSLSSVAVLELHDRLRRGQEWANEEFGRFESTQAGEESSVGLIYDLDSENGMIEQLVNGVEARCMKVEAETLKVTAEEDEIFLQTKTVSLQEVRKSLPLWIPSLQTEIDNFDNNKAIVRINEEQTQKIMADAQEAGHRAELIPGMGVFTRKAGDGRRRSRIVCCGNYMEARSGDEIYASGADSTQLRMILRCASLQQWHCLSLDVKSAFLLAPKAQGETVIVKPPKILEEAGLAQKGEHWLVSAAMYGLVTSPKDWSSFRDAELQKMVGSYDSTEANRGGDLARQFGFRPMEDPNLWAIQEVEVDPSSGERNWGKVLGHMIVYVDDILMVGPKGVTDAASRTIQSSWSTSPPEYAEVGGGSMRFLGMEIQRLADGSYFVHQGCYVREVLDRHVGGGSLPYVKVPEESEEEEAASLPKVREAQKITGERLWLSGKTRPDIAWAVMKMAQNAVKKPRWTISLGEAVLAYLRQSLNYGLHYTKEVPEDSAPDLKRSRPRHVGTLEVLVDASFSPGDGHSVSGTIILLAGCPVQWEARKQTLMALSTAEAELTSIVEGLQTGRSVRALGELLFEKIDLELYNDNRAAVVLASGSGGSSRTRHLRIRAHCLAEALKKGELTLEHRVGTSLWADGLTKPLQALHLGRFRQGIGLGDAEDKFKTKEGDKGTYQFALAESQAVVKSLSLVALGASMLPGGQAAEVCGVGERCPARETSLWADQGWLVLLAGLVCLLHMLKDLGWYWVKRLTTNEDTLKVKVMSENASLPVKGSPDAAGWDLAASSAVELQPGERRLVPLGISLELPKGCYGRIASRSSWASRGVDVAGGVIDADYRGEIKVILVNNGDETLSIHPGDRVGQLILEKIQEARVVSSSSLSSSTRGELGFGSTGSGSPLASSSSRFGESGRSPERAVRRLSAGSGGAPMFEEEEVRRLQPAGPHIFFEGVHFARPDESLPQFLRRLKERELRDFQWMWPANLIEELDRPLNRGSRSKVQHEVSQGTLEISIVRHESWRKKLFDTEVAAPPSADGITAGVVTIGWQEDGQKFVRVDNRRGNRAMCYLKSNWRGISLFFSMSSSTASGM